MSITNCQVETVDSFQVLEPEVTVPPGSAIGQYVEAGISQFSSGNKVLNVTFVTEKASALYVFDEFVIKNTVDDPVPTFEYTITSQTTTGFQVLLNATPTTVNTLLHWAVRIIT